MELRLTGELDRPGHRKGEGELSGKFPGKPQLFQGVQLPLDLLPIIHRIDIGVLLLKSAVYCLTQLPVLLEGGLLRGEVLPGAVHAELPDELVIDQSVLAGDFGGGVPGDAAAQGFGLRQRIGDSGAVQEIRAQNPRHTAADDQHIGAQLALQGRKGGLLPGLFP